MELVALRGIANNTRRHCSLRRYGAGLGYNVVRDLGSIGRCASGGFSRLEIPAGFVDRVWYLYCSN